MPTHKENLEKLEAIIKEKVEDVTALKFGCWVEHKATGIMAEYVGNNYAGNAMVYLRFSKMVKVFKHNELEIIGRPITLEDVLKVIGEKESGGWWKTVISGHGSFFEKNKEWHTLSQWPASTKWQLGQPLSAQSPETIKALLNLLS